MPTLKSIPPYSRTNTVAAIRAYYNFLTTIYLPSSAIITPPPTGWPTITPSSMRAFGKNDEVISLLAQLPYINEPSDDTQRFEGAAHTHFCDYRSGRFDQYLAGGKGDDMKILTEGLVYEHIPTYVVGLVKGGSDSPFFLLDTENGTVHWGGYCPDGPRERPTREQIDIDEEDEDDEDEEDEEDEEEDWRREAGPAWSIPDFFELLKDEFRNLNFLPISERKVLDVYTEFRPEADGMIEMLRDIYREHGWPDGSAFRKDACLAAVKKALEDRYPDYADNV